MEEEDLTEEVVVVVEVDVEDGVEVVVVVTMEEMETITVGEDLEEAEEAVSTGEHSKYLSSINCTLPWGLGFYWKGFLAYYFICHMNYGEF